MLHDLVFKVFEKRPAHRRGLELLSGPKIADQGSVHRQSRLLSDVHAAEMVQNNPGSIEIAQIDQNGSSAKSVHLSDLT